MTEDPLKCAPTTASYTNDQATIENEDTLKCATPTASCTNDQSTIETISVREEEQTTVESNSSSCHVKKSRFEIDPLNIDLI